ncbi:MAG: EthD family reductase [Capsulimonadaceae bacterium]|nr:EthD family reductase [Capsulimonadaceae bacterium]
MVKISIQYPNTPGNQFDVDYYVNKHMPMSLHLLGDAVKAASVEVGISGALPDQSPPFVAQCAFVCETAQAFYDAFMPHAEALQGDIARYTDIEPVIQISEIKISR